MAAQPETGSPHAGPNRRPRNEAVPELMPVRYERTLVSPFTFLRGAAASYPSLP